MAEYRSLGEQIADLVETGARQDIPDLLRENRRLREVLMDMMRRHSIYVQPVIEEDNLPVGSCHSFIADEGAIDLLIELGLAKITSENPLRFELLWKELVEK